MALCTVVEDYTVERFIDHIKKFGEPIHFSSEVERNAPSNPIFIGSIHRILNVSRIKYEGTEILVLVIILKNVPYGSEESEIFRAVFLGNNVKCLTKNNLAIGDIIAVLKPRYFFAHAVPSLSIGPNNTAIWICKSPKQDIEVAVQGPKEVIQRSGTTTCDSTNPKSRVQDIIPSEISSSEEPADREVAVQGSKEIIQRSGTTTCDSTNPKSRVQDIIPSEISSPEEPEANMYSSRKKRRNIRCIIDNESQIFDSTTSSSFSLEKGNQEYRSRPINLHQSSSKLTSRSLNTTHSRQRLPRITPNFKEPTLAVDSIDHSQPINNNKPSQNTAIFGSSKDDVSGNHEKLILTSRNIKSSEKNNMCSPRECKKNCQSVFECSNYCACMACNNQSFFQASYSNYGCRHTCYTTCCQSECCLTSQCQYSRHHRNCSYNPVTSSCYHSCNGEIGPCRTFCRATCHCHSERTHGHCHMNPHTSTGCKSPVKSCCQNRDSRLNGHAQCNMTHSISCHCKGFITQNIHHGPNDNALKSLTDMIKRSSEDMNTPLDRLEQTEQANETRTQEWVQMLPSPSECSSFGFLKFNSSAKIKSPKNLSKQQKLQSGESNTSKCTHLKPNALKDKHNKHLKSPNKQKLNQIRNTETRIDLNKETSNPLMSFLPLSNTNSTQQQNQSEESSLNGQHLVDKFKKQSHKKRLFSVLEQSSIIVEKSVADSPSVIDESTPFDSERTDPGWSMELTASESVTNAIDSEKIVTFRSSSGVSSKEIEDSCISSRTNATEENPSNSSNQVAPEKASHQGSMSDVIIQGQGSDLATLNEYTVLQPSKSIGIHPSKSSGEISPKQSLKPNDDENIGAQIALPVQSSEGSIKQITVTHSISESICLQEIHSNKIEKHNIISTPNKLITVEEISIMELDTEQDKPLNTGDKSNNDLCNSNVSINKSVNMEVDLSLKGARNIYLEKTLSDHGEKDALGMEKPSKDVFPELKIDLILDGENVKKVTSDGYIQLSPVEGKSESNSSLNLEIIHIPSTANTTISPTNLSNQKSLSLSDYTKVNLTLNEGIENNGNPNSADNSTPKEVTRSSVPCKEDAIELMCEAKLNKRKRRKRRQKSTSGAVHISISSPESVKSVETIDLENDNIGSVKSHSSEKTYFDAVSTPSSPKKTKLSMEAKWMMKPLNEFIPEPNEALLKIFPDSKSKSKLDFRIFKIIELTGVIIDMIPNVLVDPSSIVSGVCHGKCHKTFSVDVLDKMMIKEPIAVSSCTTCTNHHHLLCPECLQIGERNPLCLFFSFEIHFLHGENVLRVEVENQDAVEFLGCTPTMYLFKNGHEGPVKLLTQIMFSPSYLQWKKLSAQLRAKIRVKPKDVSTLTLTKTSLKEDIVHDI